MFFAAAVMDFVVGGGGRICDAFGRFSAVIATVVMDFVALMGSAEEFRFVEEFCPARITFGDSASGKLWSTCIGLFSAQEVVVRDRRSE